MGDIRTLRRGAVGTAFLAVLAVAPLTAQRKVWPTSPQERGLVGSGLAVSPFFEGWYENPDGSFTLSFGYFNRNQEEVVSIPLGPNNSIEPAQYDGRQPTYFGTGRETGVFTVTVPAEFGRNHGRVVWSIQSESMPEAHSVPGKVDSETYRLSHGPQAMGSFAPVLRMSEDGPELWGPMTVAGDAHELSTWERGRDPVGSIQNPATRTASLGSPLTLTVWIADRLAPDAEREPVEPGATWYTHQGPVAAVFSNDEPEPDEDGRVTTTVTFREPGEYMLRVRADNFNPVDSTPGDQCCWTNGYVRVNVSP